ncbi:MAG: SpoIID/LytB domain-containing protein, partial [Planctomycetota bacterium]
TKKRAAKKTANKRTTKKTAKKRATKKKATKQRAAASPEAGVSANRGGARRRPRGGLRAKLAALPRLKGLGVGLVLGVALLACVQQVQPPPPAPVVEPEPEIRVKLLERTLASQATLKLTLSEAPWELKGERGATEGIVALRTSELEVSLQNGSLHVSGYEPQGTWLELTPQEPDGTFTLEGRTYPGRLRLEPAANGKGLVAINSLGLESYLLGVVGYESPLSWDDEALCSQAVAARTYALVGLKPGRSYDVVDDTRDQVYRGLMEPRYRARVQKLVAATRGEVVTYQGKPITTYFHSTCGGDTVPAEWVFPWVHEAFEPWSGASDCPCQASKYYRWEASVDLDQKPAPGEQTAVQQLVLQLPLTKVEVEHYPRGGYAKTLILTDQSGEASVVPAWEARRVFGLRGYAFDATLGEGGTRIEFTGRGWGHGVGMCQFGSQGRAKQGWDHGKILGHYYPGTELTTLPYGELE